MDPNIRILFWIARDINGSWIGADRFEIFRERERGVVNEMHDFHNEIGRKGSASARARQSIETLNRTGALIRDSSTDCVPPGPHPACP